jgi:phosphoribosylformimino-5-aminoimidazole carboxamide ribotide isomerase
VIAIPGIDLKAGACTPLDAAWQWPERTPRDAVTLVRELGRVGFHRVHLSDLEARQRSVNRANREVVRAILSETVADIQVRGPYSEMDEIRELLSSGARYAVVDSKGTPDAAWLSEAADLFADEMILAVDLNGRRLAKPGPVPAFSPDVFDIVEDLRGVALAALLVTDVERRGQLSGPNLMLLEDLAQECAFPLYAAGGIASIDQLRALEERALAGAVIGRALHEGLLDHRALAEEFPS